jgi:hypothetical protein
MNVRSRLVTVRTYNLMPGDTPVTHGVPVASAATYRGLWESWTDVGYVDGTRETVHPDDLVTVTRQYA